MEPENRWKQMQYSLMKEVNANGIKKLTKKNIFAKTTKTNMSSIQREHIAHHILGDLGVVSGGGKKSKRARKKFGRRKVKNEKKAS